MLGYYFFDLKFESEGIVCLPDSAQSKDVKSVGILILMSSRLSKVLLICQSYNEKK